MSEEMKAAIDALDELSLEDLREASDADLSVLASNLDHWLDLARSEYTRRREAIKNQGDLPV